MNRYLFFSVLMTWSYLPAAEPKPNKETTDTPFWVKDSPDEKQEKSWSNYGTKKDIFTTPYLLLPLTQNGFADIALIPKTQMVAIRTTDGGITVLTISTMNNKYRTNRHELFESYTTNLAGGSCTNMIAFTSEEFIFGGAVRQNGLTYNYDFGKCTLDEGCHVNSIAFDPTDKIIAGGCDDGSIRTWDMDRGKAVIRGHPSIARIIALAFLDENTLCYSSSQLGLHMYDLRSSTKSVVGLKPFVVQAIAASANHGFILGGGRDGTVYLYDVRKDKVLYEAFPTKTKSPITSLAVYYPFKEFLVGQEDGSCLLRRIDTPRLAYGPKSAHTSRVSAIATKNPTTDDDYFAASVGEDNAINFYGPKPMYFPETLKKESDKKYDEGTNK